MRLYRRHGRNCKFFGTEDAISKSTCNCKIYADTGGRGKAARVSLGTRDMARAEARLRRMQLAAENGKPVMSVNAACQAFLSDCQRRNLKLSTIRSYEKALDHLMNFCKQEGMEAISEVNGATLLEFQNSREAPAETEGEKAMPLEASTARKELQILRAFFGFLLDHEHVEANYAQKLKPPREHRRPTMPFSQPEVDALLLAAATLDDDNPGSRERTRAHARAALLVMLYSGLRISDTATLERARVNLDDGRLRLRMEKTGEPVYVRLGQPAVDALRALSNGGRYFFWTGESNAATAIGNLRRTVYRVCQKAGVEGHPHRFRDTFAVRLLEHGVALDQVSILLGHTSIKTTQKYYAPWVRSRQKLLDQATAVLDFTEATTATSRRLRRVK